MKFDAEGISDELVYLLILYMRTLKTREGREGRAQGEVIQRGT